jgi:hypothetical protein
MYNVMVKCPETGLDVSTGIVTDEQTFNRLPASVSSMHCPHCGVAHAWSSRNAWLEGTRPVSTPPAGGLFA